MEAKNLDFLCACFLVITTLNFSQDKKFLKNKYIICSKTKEFIRDNVTFGSLFDSSDVEAAYKIKVI